MKVLVTGAAGFIGMHVSERLLARGDQVVRIDNLNDYYDVAPKRARLARLTPRVAFRHVDIDIADRSGMAGPVRAGPPDAVINLAAQAVVRYSLVNPQADIGSNIVGFANILESCRHQAVFLHRLRSVGPAGHGAVPLYHGDSGGSSD